MKNYYEVITYWNGGYNEEVDSTFDTFEEAQRYCWENNETMCADEEGLYILCHEDGRTYEVNP